MIRRSRRLFGLFTAFTLTFSTVTGGWRPAVTNALVGASDVETVKAVDTQTTATQTADYGLADNVQDGTILHCFDWKYTDIIAELPNIAEAGFTSVQTSPAQKGCASSGAWYWLYQPIGFYIPTESNGLGTKAELQQLCTEAEKYGIKVVVDVVANHLAGWGASHGSQHGFSGGVPSEFNDYLHDGTYSTNKNNVNWSDRYQVTHCDIGMPDLDTSTSFIQTAVYNYIQDLKSIGVDGIRFDAAKHIGLPSEGDNFWEEVTKDRTLFYYGEILQGPIDYNGSNSTQQAALMEEYTNYISLTDDSYGNDKTWSYNNGQINSAVGNYSERGVDKDKLVYWAESHDTYSNGGGTRDLNTNVIDRSYATLAAQGYATTLYYSRPAAKDKDGIHIGVKGSTHFTSAEVAEVNKFHNAMIGTKEWDVFADGISAICRGDGKTTGGAVIVLGTGSNKDVSVTNGGSLVPAGTYTDQISGNTFTVTASTISGKVGGAGIAAIYNSGNIVRDPMATISREGGEFGGDLVSVELGLKYATSGTYKIGSAAAVTFTGSKTIEIGKDLSVGESVTVTLTATNGTDTTTNTYTFTKVDKVVNIAKIKLPSGWGTDVYCYAYDSATEKVSNGEWPGVKMTKEGDYYVYEIPENIAKPRVIFYNSDTNRTPADMIDGYLFETDGTWKYENGSWSKEESVEKGTVVVKYVDASGNEIASSKTMTGNVGSSYTTTAATVSGYTLKSTPSNATGTYTSGTTTVTYIYEASVPAGPLVTASLASGSTFETEAASVTLTLVNATSGTYKIDNGIKKTFTGSTTIKVGQGKIADTTVTVEVTATNGTTTTTQTLTYNKKFKNTINEATSSSVASANTSTSTAGTLAKYYATNPNGNGLNKTITIDGDASDWSEDMLIAKAGAWDVANHWKGGHENCVLDTTALYAAWDDTNLYIAWQMVNTTDTWARPGDGPLSDGAAVLDVPLILALSVDPSSVSMTNKNTTGGSIWGERMGLSFDTHVDRLFYMSGKPGLGKPSMFTAADAEGNTNYTTACVGYLDGGIEYKLARTNISSNIYGLNGSESEADVCDDNADWVDYKTFTGSAGGHDISFDSFYEMKIPFDTLGITKSYLESNGIGAMLIATRGESALDCIPYDLSMVDHVSGDYSADPSTSLEKEDVDVITSSFARVGGGVTPPPSAELKLNFGADKSAPQAVGTTLTLSAKATGGSGSYTKYQYYVNGTAVSSNTTGASYSWTPSAAGTYVIKCVVTDSEGKTVTSSKYYTIEGETVITKPEVTLKAGDNKIDVSWSAVTGATKYRVYKYVNGAYSTVATVTGTSYTITGLEGNKEYGVLVRAYVNGAYTSYTTADNKYATPTGVAKPSVTVTAGVEKLSVRWGAVTGATKYRVYKYVNGTYTKLGDTTTTSYTISGLAGGVKTGVLVRAFVKGAFTAYDNSDLVYGTPIKSTVAKPVVTVTAGNASLSVSWSAVSGATKYRIYKYVNGTYTKVTDTTATSYTVSGLTNGTKVGILVRAYVNGAFTSYTTADNVYGTPSSSIDSTKPVVTLTAGDSKIDVSWNTVSGATKYRVYKYVNGTYTKLEDTTSTSMSVTGLTNGTKVGILVRAYVNGAFTAYTLSDNVYATPTK